MEECDIRLDNKTYSSILIQLYQDKLSGSKQFWRIKIFDKY